MIKSNYTV
jgi:hypothetical protein